MLDLGLGTVIGAGIGGISSLLGSAFGSKSQSDVNETNLQIARETNKANREQLETQQQFALDMWNKEQEYNRLSNQVSRAREAGINPSAIIGNGSAEVAGQISDPAGNPMIGATMQAYDPSRSFSEVGNIAEQAINGYYQNRLLNSQVHKTEQEAKSIGDLLPHQIAQLKALAKREDFLGDIARNDLFYYQAVQGQRISQAFNDTRMQEIQQKQILEQTAGVQLQNKLAQVQLAYAPRLNDAQLRQYNATISQIRADIGLIMARRDLTLQQRENLVTENLGHIVDNGMKGLDFKLKQETLKTSVSIAKEQLYMMEDERYFMPYQKAFEMQGNAGKWLPSPAGQYGASQLFERNYKRDRFRK